VSRMKRVIATAVAAGAAALMLAAPAHAESVSGYCDDGRPNGEHHYLEGYAAYAVDGQWHNWYLFLGRFGAGFSAHLGDENNLEIWFHSNGVQMFHEWEEEVDPYVWYGWGANLWTLDSDHEVTRFYGIFDIAWSDTRCNDWAET
jgi:hypothetical protein